MLGINSKRKQMNGEYVQAVKMVKCSTMPCVFSEEEMNDEVRMSELSGTVTHEEVLENLKGRARYENRLE